MAFKLALFGLAAAVAFGSRAFAEVGAPISAPAASPGDNALETIVVTATKRSESVQDVAGQVTAMTAGDLSKIHARSFEDFAAFVPGLSYQSTSPANNLIAIRGITTGGTQLSGAIGLYLDDVPVGASSSFGLGAQSFDVNVFDLDRVEVLNGPQGTLYGASSLGGALKYVTAAPDLSAFFGRAELEGSATAHGSGNDGVRAMLNFPLLDGRAALRIDGVQQYDSGYANDPTHDRTHVGAGLTSGGHASFLAEITPDLDIRLSAFTQKTSGEGFDVSFRDPATHAPTQGTYDQSFPLAQPSFSSLNLYSGVVNWDLHWSKLTSVTGYQIDHGQSLTDESAAYDAILVPIFGAAGDNPYGLPVDTETKKFTQEIRLASPDNKTFEWLVGGFFSHEITREYVDLINAADAHGNLFGFAPFNSYLPSDYSERGAYADGTIFLGTLFDVTLGVRHSENRQVYQQISYGLFNNPADPAAVSHLRAGSSESVTTYLINPRLRISDDSMLYARIASGYRPGGPNFVLAPGLGNPTFKADKLWNYEVGEKSTVLDKKATLNVDVYDIEWSSIQLTVNNGGVNQLENAGNARVRGAELSFDYHVLPALTLGGSAAYTDAKLVTTAPQIGIAYTGARLPLSPKFNFAALANYNFPITDRYTGNLSVTDRYLGDRTTGFRGSLVSPLYRLASYNTVDLSAALQAPHGLEVDLYVKNVFDVAGEVSANAFSNEYNPAAPVPVWLSLPRTVGLILKVRFGQ